MALAGDDESEEFDMLAAFSDDEQATIIINEPAAQPDDLEFDMLAAFSDDEPATIINQPQQIEIPETDASGALAVHGKHALKSSILQASFV